MPMLTALGRWIRRSASASLSFKGVAMSRRFVVGIIITASLAIVSWALAQQERPVAKAPALAEGGPFVVSPAGQSAVLLDTKSGKTWVLTHSVEGVSVWLPTRRIDSEQEAQEWQEREKKIK